MLLRRPPKAVRRSEAEAVGYVATVEESLSAHGAELHYVMHYLLDPFARAAGDSALLEV